MYCYYCVCSFCTQSQHFETDDPDLYRFKIEQIRTSDIADLDLSLTFTDEVYDGRQLSSPLVCD